MAIIVIYIVLAIVAATVAKNKGRSQVGWFFASLLLTPLTILILLALPAIGMTDRPPRVEAPSPPEFEAQAFYKGTPYRIEESGHIEAMLPGGRVLFHNIEEFMIAMDGGTIPLATDDDRLITLINSAFGLATSDTMVNELRDFKKQIESRSIDFEDRKYVAALCRRLLHQQTPEGSVT